MQSGSHSDLLLRLFLCGKASSSKQTTPEQKMVPAAPILAIFALLYCSPSVDAGLSSFLKDYRHDDFAKHHHTWQDSLKTLITNRSSDDGLFVGKHALQRFRDRLQRKMNLMNHTSSSFPPRDLQTDPCRGVSRDVEFVAYGSQWFSPTFAYECASSLRVNVDDMVSHIVSIFLIFYQSE